MTQSIAGTAAVSQEKVTSRTLVVVAAIFIQLCLGALYAWSVFTPALTRSIADGGAFGFSKT